MNKQSSGDKNKLNSLNKKKKSSTGSGSNILVWFVVLKQLNASKSHGLKGFRFSWKSFKLKTLSFMHPVNIENILSVLVPIPFFDVNS